MKIPLSNIEVTVSPWKLLTMAAAVILAWVWIQSQFLGVSEFEVYASGVQVQQTLTAWALLIQELRWLQAQKRAAVKDNDQAEASRLVDEIARVTLDLKNLK